MAIPRRLRFEVLRRDGHRCRYCGVSPKDARLTVDHVIPEALGGPTTPQNLVSACDPCNSGKASTAPDANTVAAVDERALRWREAIRRAGEELAAERWLVDHQLAVIEDAWRAWHHSDGSTVPLPSDWLDSVERLLIAGLDTDAMQELIGVAMRSHLAEDRWRYFCGCAWRRVDQLHTRALQLLGEA